jgi:UDP-N-acetylmuramoyl-L-alanyl-D-glutamate--2,6-diaminopimelate ligase
MRLSELARELHGASLQGEADPEISAVANDSRDVSLGSIFVAVVGLKADGHGFLKQAIAARSSAIAVQPDRRAMWAPIVAESGVPTLVVPDTRAALAQIAAALNGYPARHLRTIGVTGTDGKTSLSHLLHHVLASGGEKAGLISTAECRVGEELLPDTGRFTTPEAPEVQQMLARMVAAGCRYAVVEATSHGLALHRVDECDFDVGVFTNLYPDHLDFHGTVEDYIAAKGRLFSMLDSAARKDIGKTAVLNADDAVSARFAALTSARIVRYGVHSAAEVLAVEIAPDGWGTRFSIRAFGEERSVRIASPGEFNVYNALAAYAVAGVCGLEPAATIAGLERWPGAPGRMQLVEAGQPFTVVVDFAHAPESLRRLLNLARDRSSGRIIAVFGCIGERDKDRRFRMGKVAAECADYTIVTDDNPYSEDRDAIIAEIARGLRDAGKREGHDFAVIPDRREAISQAIAMAVDGDAVVLAGKGHEREVHLPGSTYQCHDPTAAREVLAELGYTATDRGRRNA